MYDVIVKIGELVDEHIAVVVSFIYGMALIMFLVSVTSDDLEGVIISLIVALGCGAGMQLVHSLVNKNK